MADREKVIKKLSVMIQSDSEEWDTIELPIEQAKDILALLKEQEQTINELKEKLRLLEYGDQDILQSGMMPAT